MNQYTVEYTSHGTTYRETVFAESEEVVFNNIASMVSGLTSVYILSTVTFGERPLDGVRVIGKVRSTVQRPDLETVSIRM